MIPSPRLISGLMGAILAALLVWMPLALVAHSHERPDEAHTHAHSAYAAQPVTFSNLAPPAGKHDHESAHDPRPADPEREPQSCVVCVVATIEEDDTAAPDGADGAAILHSFVGKTVVLSAPPVGRDLNRTAPRLQPLPAVDPARAPPRIA